MNVPPNAPEQTWLEKTESADATTEAGPEFAPADLNEPRESARFVDTFFVDRRLWIRCAGLLLLGAVGLVVLSLLDAELMNVGPTQGFALVALAAAGGWGIAYAIESHAIRKEERRDGIEPPVPAIVSFVVLIVLTLPMLRWLTGHVDVTAFWMGTIERLMVVAAIWSLFVAIATGVGLHRGVAQFAALLVAMALLAAEGRTDSASNEQVSAATGAQLALATKTGEPILLRGADHDPDVRVDGDRPADRSAKCQTTTFTDRDHTLLGFRGRTLDFDFDACWSGAGAPRSLTVAARRYRGFTGGDAFAVRLVPASPFDRVALPPTPGASIDRPGDRQRIRYGDERTDLSSEPLDTNAAPLEMRGEDGLIRDDGLAKNDTVLARVSDDGAVITVILAVESLDGVFARPGYRDEKRRTYERLAGSKPQPGRSLDVVTATIRRDGRSVATLRRTTARD